MKIYLVSTGDYSDWSVRGLFSTREVAEKFAALLGDANPIDEWEVDRCCERAQQGVSVWLVWSKEGGVVDVRDAYNFGVDCEEPVGKVDWFPEHGDKMRVYVEASDEAHAVKIAADKFREHIAGRRTH